MRRLGPTVSRLNTMRRASMAAMAKFESTGASGRLGTMTGFGSNPGALIAKTYLPATLAPGAPLVVVLHGCTQNAAAYDHGSGWSDLADRHGFALLFPEQTRSNNHNLCFNWFETGDTRRGQGEAASVAQMVRHMLAAHDLDPARIFITGLSAGGAMTAAMLATYPELFAGGAVIAGLPYGVADNVPQALERMRGQGMPSRAALASKIANASDHDGPWPTLSVWHGSADVTVVPANAGVIVDQWRDRIGLDAAPQVDRIDGHKRTAWRDASGRVAVERFDVAGMGHGTPLSTRGEESCGSAGAHMLEAGICSTSRIAASWGLTGKVARQAARPETVRPPVAPSPKPAAAPQPRARPAAASPRAKGVGAVIEDALRAAGLMR